MLGLKNWKNCMIPLSEVTDELIAKWNKICDERKPKCKCGKNAISHMDVCEDCYYEQLGDEIENNSIVVKQNVYWMVNSGNVIIPLKKPYPVDY